MSEGAPSTTEGTACAKAQRQGWQFRKPQGEGEFGTVGAGEEVGRAGRQKGDFHLHVQPSLEAGS